MKKRIINIVFLIVCTTSLSLSQTASICENTDLGIAFTASSQWTQLNVANTDVLELVNSNNNLKVKMWFMQTKIKAQDVLQTLFREEGLATSGEPFNLMVDNREAEGLVGLCNEMHHPVKILLLAIKGPEGFYIIRFKCPDVCYGEHQKQLDKLISAVKLVNKSESHLFFADHRGVA